MRDRFILVTGFHHTGTTIVQAQLRRQGVFTFVEETRDGHLERPLELPLRHLHRIERVARRAGRRWFMTKLCTNSAGAVRQMGVELRLLARDCTVVVCQRDPAALVPSLSRRYGWDPVQALADAAMQQRVLDGWRAFARRYRGPIHFVPLEAFSRGPEHYLRRILQVGDEPLPVPVETVAADGGALARKVVEDALPDPREHWARRRAQAHLPVYPVDPDAWMETENGEVLAVLEAIRRRFGASPAEFEAAGRPPGRGDVAQSG